MELSWVLTVHTPDKIPVKSGGNSQVYYSTEVRVFQGSISRILFLLDKKEMGLFGLFNIDNFIDFG